MSAGAELDAIYALLHQQVAHAFGPYRTQFERYLEEARAGESPEWSVTRLSLFACEAAGGRREQAYTVAAAWRALHLGADLLDDVEDDLLAARAIPRHALDVNLATGLIVVSQQVLGQLATAVSPPIVARFHSTVLRMASGQHLDLCRRSDLSLDDYYEIMAAKSGAFFELALAAGALASGMTEVGLYEEVGMALGLLIQIGDDDVGLRRPLTDSDLALGVYSLPVLYGFDVSPPSVQRQLRELMARAIHDPAAAAAVRRLLQEAGSQIYMRSQLLLMQRRLQRACARLDKQRAQGLLRWVEKLYTDLELPPSTL